MTDMVISTGPAPLAGRDVWQQVMEAAGYRCQCTKRHPSHRSGQCEAAHGVAGVRLVAGPPVPPHDPARTMTEAGAALVAWCGGCWDAEVNAARRHHKNEADERAHSGMDGLF